MPNASRRLDGHQLRPLPILPKEAQVGVVAEGGVYYASIPHPALTAALKSTAHEPKCFPPTTRYVNGSYTPKEETHRNRV
jgi:hypothetical protein